MCILKKKNSPQGAHPIDQVGGHRGVNPVQGSTVDKVGRVVLLSVQLPDEDIAHRVASLIHDLIHPNSQIRVLKVRHDVLVAGTHVLLPQHGLVGDGAAQIGLEEVLQLVVLKLCPWNVGHHEGLTQLSAQHL